MRPSRRGVLAAALALVAAVAYESLPWPVARAVVYDLAVVALVVVVWLRVARAPQQRRLWWLVTLLGFVLLAVGNVVWDWMLLNGGDPTGGVADWIFVGGYASSAVGLLGVAAGHDRKGWVGIGLEATAAGALAGALAWVWGGAEAITAGEGAGAVVAVALVVFSVVRTLAMLRVAWSRRRRWRLAVAAAGMSLWLVADIVYVGSLVSVLYKTGGWLDAVWLAATVLLVIGFGGRQVPCMDAAEPVEDGRLVLVRRAVLVSAVVGAPAVVLFSGLNGWGERAVLAGLLVVAGLAVVARFEWLTSCAEQVRRERDEAEGRYEQLFDGTTSPMLLVDPADGRIVDANPAAVALYGYDRATLRSMVISQINTLSDDQIAAEMARARRGVRVPFEFRHRLASGTVIPVDVYSGPVNVDGRQLLFSIVHDASGRHTALDEVRDSGRRWRQLAELAEDMVYRATYRDGRIASFDYVNPAGHTVLGVAPATLMADPTLVAEHVHPDDRLFLTSDEHQDGTMLRTFRWRRPDDRTVWLQDAHTRIADTDGTYTVVGIVRDVTAQHHTEQALRSALRQQEEVAEELHRVNRMKTTFLQTVSHELRTPMTSLVGFLTTLRAHGDALDEAQHDLLLARADHNAQRLRRLLDDLLDVNRLSHGIHATAEQQGDVGTMLQTLIATMDLNGHEIHLEVTDGRIVGDVVLIDRALENLLDNGLRHTPPGTTVGVHVTRDNHDPTLLEIVVEDDGPGLPEDVADHIFDPFVQGPQAASDPNPGIGIGLTLTAQIASVHGGSLTAENRTEGGARFRLVLRDQTASPADHRPTPPAASSRSPGLQDPATAEARQPGSPS